MPIIPRLRGRMATRHAGFYIMSCIDATMYFRSSDILDSNRLRNWKRMLPKSWKMHMAEEVE
jgi:hypothetical protein